VTFKPTDLDHKRVRVIGNAMMRAKPGVKAMCCVDADDRGKYQGKGDWYEAQFQERYPAIIIGKRFDGPTAGCHTIMLESPPIRRRGHSDN
jgi:hypothetical protein